jgi:LPXTG-motif cell wall-anchored protein
MMTKKDDKAPATGNGTWAGAAAIAGAAIGSAAVAAALLYANRRKDRTDQAKTPPLPDLPPETD